MNFALARHCSAGLIALLFLGCKPAQSPYDRFGWRDSQDQSIVSEVAAAIKLVNFFLGNGGSAASLYLSDETKAKAPNTGIPVYVIRASAAPDNDTTAQADELVLSKQSRAFFIAELAQIHVDPAYENCKDADPCAWQVYKNATAISSAVARLMRNFQRVEAAATRADCGCIVLRASDLRAFRIFFGSSLLNNVQIPIHLYLVWILLHEVGHREPNWKIPQNMEWSHDFAALYEPLTPAQQEEMRADAFATQTIVNGCFRGPKDSVAKIRDSCLIIPLHSLQVFAYLMLDKSDTGMKRTYLDCTESHPNYLLRTLSMSLMFFERTEGTGAFSLVKDYLKTRDFFADKFLIGSLKTKYRYLLGVCPDS